MLLGDELQNLRPGDFVEVAGGLVGKQDVRIVHESPGDGHPLALAAGELAGPVPQAVTEAERLEKRRGPGPALPVACAEPLEAAEDLHPEKGGDDRAPGRARESQRKPPTGGIDRRQQAQGGPDRYPCRRADAQDEDPVPKRP